RQCTTRAADNFSRGGNRGLPANKRERNRVAAGKNIFLATSWPYDPAREFTIAPRIAVQRCIFCVERSDPPDSGVLLFHTRRLGMERQAQSLTRGVDECCICRLIVICSCDLHTVRPTTRAGDSLRDDDRLLRGRIVCTDTSTRQQLSACLHVLHR